MDILIEAIPHVLNHVPTAMFVFAGDGEMRWDLERATKTRNLERNTRWLGNVSGERLRSLFKSCDAVCVPSRNEPFGIVILEAWSAHKQKNTPRQPTSDSIARTASSEVLRSRLARSCVMCWASEVPVRGNIPTACAKRNTI